jgi:aldoxime dehydratase
MTHEAVSPRPLRKPKGFEPSVQRWSIALAAKHDAFFVTFFGVQGEAASLSEAPLLPWLARMFERPDGPSVHDHARHVDEDGLVNHIVAAYWIDEADLLSWSSSFEATSFWDDPARLLEPYGYFRESMRVPVSRQETIYWKDYPAALSRSPEVALYPTPFCGYYGAMRDRLSMVGTDPFDCTVPSGMSRRPPAASKGARLRVVPPENLAVIRSAVYWGGCDDEQRDDFMVNLRRPLDTGMQFLRENADVTGCCSLRYQQTCDLAGSYELETHAIGYFLSLSHLEDWSERHSSHHAIFSSAMARYKKYGPRNQLRTWHEVYVLPESGNAFDYVNCSPGTGLLPWFDAHRLDPLAAS